MAIFCRAWGKFLPEAVYGLNQCPMYGAISPTARIHRSTNQGVEIGMLPLPIISSDPLPKFLLPVPVNLCSVGLKVLVAKGKLVPAGDTMLIPSNWQLRLPWPLWAYCASELIGKEGCYFLAEMTDPNH